MAIVKIHLGCPKGWIGKLIGWQTRSPYCHAAVTVNGWTYEAGRNGMDPVTCYEERPQEWEDFHAEISQDAADTMQAFLDAQLGKPYDVTMVLRFLSRRQETRKSKGRWFCSELVAAAFQEAGRPLLARTEPWEVSPGLLARSPLLRL